MAVPSKLTMAVQVGYATAEAGINTVETILRLYLLAFYTDVVGLSAGLTGLAASLAIVWDAITDPIMGVVSDRLRDRLGGRRAWLPGGGLLLALGVLAVFWPPDLTTQGAKFAWLLLAYCFLNTGMTVLSVPYMAMAGEMTEDPHQRTTLFGARFAFSNGGAFVAAGLPVLFLREGEGNSATMPMVSTVAAAFVVGTSLWSWRATARVRFLRPPLQRESLQRAFLVPFGNATFRPLIAAYVVVNVGIGINAATFLYYYQHVLEVGEGQRQAVLAVFLAVFTASIAMWVVLARRFGKRRPLLVGAIALSLGTPALYLSVPVGGFAWVMGFGAFGLGAMVGSIVLLDTLLTDVLDHDLLTTGQLRSGLYFGVWRFASKMARAVSVLVVGGVLAAVGFVEQSHAQPPAVAVALTVLFGPGVGVCFAGAVWILWRYRFDDAQQARVRRLLRRREVRAAARAPGVGVSAGAR